MIFLDTNVVSETLNKAPDEAVMAWLIRHDAELALPTVRAGWKVLKKKRGFRMLMDLIPRDASLVKGSHGRRPEDQQDWPVFITQEAGATVGEQVDATAVHDLILGVLDGRR